VKSFKQQGRKIERKIKEVRPVECFSLKTKEKKAI